VRLIVMLLALPLFVVQAHAQTQPPSSASQSPASKPTHVQSTAQLTMQQRFERANTTHDGQLTEEQAKIGYRTIAKHFAAIDRDRKGYITEDDIRAYRKSQRLQHHQSATTRRQPNGQAGGA
jgi:hypothetical protein